MKQRAGFAERHDHSAYSFGKQHVSSPPRVVGVLDRHARQGRGLGFVRRDVVAQRENIVVERQCGRGIEHRGHPMLARDFETAPRCRERLFQLRDEYLCRGDIRFDRVDVARVHRARCA